jgi:hypothetical protein
MVIFSRASCRESDCEESQEEWSIHALLHMHRNRYLYLHLAQCDICPSLVDVQVPAYLSIHQAKNECLPHQQIARTMSS